MIKRILKIGVYICQKYKVNFKLNYMTKTKSLKIYYDKMRLIKAGIMNKNFVLAS